MKAPVVNSPLLAATEAIALQKERDEPKETPVTITVETAQTKPENPLDDKNTTN